MTPPHQHTPAETLGIVSDCTESGLHALLEAVQWQLPPPGRAPPLIPACVVVAPQAVYLRVEAPAKAAWRLTVQPEMGEAHVLDGRGPTAVQLPTLCYGYHAVHVACGESVASQSRIVAPPRCVASTAIQGDVLSRPPVRQLFVDGLHLDIASVPEFEHCPAAQRYVAQPHVSATLRSLRQATHVDEAAIHALTTVCLQSLFDVFRRAHLEVDTPRGRAFHAYTAAQGVPLYDFAVFCALATHFAAQGITGDWHTWPVSYQSPQSAAVQRFAAAHADAVALRMYLQFELDRQRGSAAQQTGAAGPCQTLAIASGFAGADPWLFRSSFTHGVAVGLPPNAPAPLGQNFGRAPLNPHTLALDGYRYWRLLLGSALSHSGALRINDARALFEQFWIPQNFAPKDGAYVRYPHQDLLGIVALESQRHDAPVVADTCNALTPAMRQALTTWGITAGGKRRYSALPQSGATSVHVPKVAPADVWQRPL